MKVLFFLDLVATVLFTGFVIFANMMKTSDMGGFVGADMLAIAWLTIAVFGAATIYWR